MTEARAADDSATINGITLYGVIDINLTYLSHGDPASSSFPPGTEPLISKNSAGSVFTLGESGMSQSKIGLKGAEDLGDGWTGFFRLETVFNPISGQLGDALKATVAQNGKPLNQQSSGGDANFAGQAFAGQANVGVKSDTYGTLTLGRQYALTLDDVANFDPQGGSYAFSLIGYSGTYSGMGNTENARVDNSIKYVLDTIGPIHLAALYQTTTPAGTPAGVEEVAAGVDYGPFSSDFTLSHTKDAVSVGALSAAQVLTAPAGTLAGTVSDNTVFTGMAKYIWGPARFYVGYEHIYYANPSHPLPIGANVIGSYQLGAVNNTAYGNNKILTNYWFGMKYFITPVWEVTGAYYHVTQNNYDKDNGCNQAYIAASCSGGEDLFSLSTVYHFSKKFDAYAGLMYSTIYGGLANGYLHTDMVDPAVGIRVYF